MAAGCCGGHAHEHHHPQQQQQSIQIDPNEPPHAEGQIIDVSGDGGVMKEVLVQGSGERPSGHEVEVHYTGTLQDGTKFDSSRDRDAPFRFVLGEGQVIRGWDLGVASMCVGEKAMLKLKPEYGYGEAGAGGTIPPNANLNFEVELLSFRKRPKSKHSMQVEEKLQAATDCKEQGNACFKEKKFREAEAEYLQGIDYLEGAENWTPEEQKAQASVELPLRLNIANCCLKSGDYSAAIEHASVALSIDSSSSKAWYRRGLGRMGNGDLVEALGDIAHAAKIEPNSTEIRREYEKCKELLAAQKKRERSTFGNMFNRVDLYTEKKGLRNLNICPKAFMDISIGDAEVVRLVFALYQDICPKTVENFLSLCTGKVKDENGPLTYKNCSFHRVIQGFMMQGGDFTNGDGTGGKSIYGPTFDDESFAESHTKRGQLSMANSGQNTNGSQFFITFGSASHLDGKHVVFGEVIEGLDALDAFEKLSTDDSDKPSVPVIIKDCGVLA